MPGTGNFQLVGIEAIVQGMAAFTRDANSVDRLMNQIGDSTKNLSKISIDSWDSVEKATSKAIDTITTGTALAVAAIAGLVTGTVAIGAAFDQNVVRAGVIADATSGQIRDLGDTVLKVGSNSRLGLGDLAAAENDLIRSGISLTDINNGVLKATNDLAEASGGELGLSNAAKLVSVGFNVWGIAAQDVTKFTGAVTAAANLSAIGFSEVSNAMQLTAPLAVTMGISFQDLAATFALFGQAGIKGTIAGTALKTMLTNLADPSKRALIEMKQFGITLTDVNGVLLPYPEILARITNAFSDEAVASGKVTDQQRLQASAILFGTRSILGALAIANKGTDAFNNMRTAIANTDPTVLANKMRDSLIPQLDVLNNRFQAFIITLSLPLTQAIGKGVKSLNDLIGGMNPEIPKVFGAALLAAFSGVGIDTIGDRLREVLGPNIGQVFSDLLRIFESIRTALITKLVPSFVNFTTAIFNNTDVVGSFSQALSGVSRIIESMSDDITKVIGIMTSFVTAIKQGIVSSQTMALVLQTLAGIPFIAFLTVFGTLAFRLAAAAVQAALLAATIRIVIDIVSAFASNWNGTMASMVSAINQLPVSLQVLGIAVTTVAAIITTSLVKQALVGLVAGIVTANAAIILMIGDFLTVLGPAALVGAIFLGYEVVTGHIQNIVDAFNKLPPVLKAVAIAATVVATILAVNFAITAATAVIGAIASIGSAIAIVVTGLGVAVTSIAAIGIAIAPVILIITAVVAAAVGLYLAWTNNFLGIQQVTQKVWDVIVQVIKVSSIPILLVIGTIIAIVNVLTAVWNSNFLGIRDTTTAVVNSLIGILTNMGQTITDVSNTIINIGTVFVSLWNANLFGAQDTAIKFVSNVITGISDLINSFKPFLDAINFVVGAFDNNFLGIQDTARNVFNGIINSVNFFIREIEKLPGVKDALDKVGVAFIDLQTTATNAGNAIVQGLTAGSAAIYGFAQNVLANLPRVDAQISITAANIQSMLAFAADTNKYLGEYGSQYGYGGSSQVAVPPAYPQVPLSVPGFPSPVGGGGAGATKAAADNTKELAAAFERLLASLPGNVKALSEFLAGLAHLDASRFQPMVNALLASRGLLEDINSAYARILTLTEAITQTQSDINKLQALQNLTDLAAKRATFGLTQQQNTLSIQALQIQQQLLPIQQAIAAIDKQIADLQRVNLDYQRQILELQIQALPLQQAIAVLDRQINALQRTNYDTVIATLQIQQQMLPIQQAIAAIDKQIAAAQRENLQNTLATDQFTADSLPIRQQIADLETQINRTVDTRTTLLKRQQEIMAQKSVDSLTSQLNSTQTQLDAAWKTMNVPQILALEAQKESLTNSVTTAQDQLTSIQDQQKLQSQNEELAQINLKLQEQSLTDILNTYDDQITVLKNQKDQYDANQAVIIDDLNIQKQAQTDLLQLLQDQLDAINNEQAARDLQTQLDVANLQKTKQALEDQLQPILDQIDAINNLKDAQDLQNQLAINGLEAQKRALEDLAAPLQARLLDIQNESAAIQLQIDTINALATQQKAQYDAQILDDQQVLADLTSMKLSEQERFDNLVTGFANAIVASGAFTSQEAIEVATRLGFGDEQITKIGQIADAYSTTLVNAAHAATDAINNIPRDVTVTVDFVVPPMPSFQYGGTVPGHIGSPQLVMAHGGEHFLGVGTPPPPMFATAAANRAASNTSNVVNNYIYEVNATYQQPQSVGNVALDLRAVIAMSKR